MKSLPKAVLWLPAALLLAIFGPAPARAATPSAATPCVTHGFKSTQSGSADPTQSPAGRAAISAHVKELGLPVW